MRPATVVGLAAWIACGLGAAGCGDDDTAGTPTAGPDRIEVTDAWARASPEGVTAGAAYLTIESETADRMLGAEVPPEVAAAVELHETVAGGASTAASADAMEGHDMPPTDGTAMAMTMREVPEVTLRAGDPVTFAPGGLHLMLLDLARPLTSGSSFELTLTFATAASQQVTVEVRDGPP